MWEYKEDGNSKVQISHAGSPISSLVQLDRVQVINYLVSIHPPVVSFSRCFRRMEFLLYGYVILLTTK